MEARSVMIGPAEMRRIARLHGFCLVSVDDDRGWLLLGAERGWYIWRGRYSHKHFVQLLQEVAEHGWLVSAREHIRNVNPLHLGSRLRSPLGTEMPHEPLEECPMNPFKSKAFLICITVAITLSVTTTHVLHLGIVGAALVGGLYGIIAGRLAAKHDLKKRLPTRRS